ncbi:MAG: penicillin acylase family protein, partial [Rhodobacteraceae bacterium]|nr:penicillin acylase family protein [Paracoccaceae bacterium]
PASGYIINANNDPIGTTFDNNPWNQFRAGFNGVLYLSSGYATGYRSGQLQQQFDSLLASGGKLSLTDNIEVQGNTQLLDAQVLSPYLLAAHANADAAVAPELAPYNSTNDPQLADAIARLAAWDFSTPTGIIEGFDIGDNPLAPVPPSAAEIDASVAASIYALWRGQAVQSVVDTTLANRVGVCTGDFLTLCDPTNSNCGAGPGGACFPIDVLSAQASGSAQSMALLRKLLDGYSINGGTGVSLINFFNVPGVANQDTARDIVLLQALRNALDLAASP